MLSNTIPEFYHNCSTFLSFFPTCMAIFCVACRGMLTCLQKKAQGQVRFGDQGQDPAAFANPAVAVSAGVLTSGLGGGR